MDYSYDYKESSNIRGGEGIARSRPLLSKTGIQSLAGAVLLAALLILSGNLDNLFMNELVAVSVIWALVSLVRLQGDSAKNTSDEKR